MGGRVMPNWCQNILIVRGDADKVQRFAEAVKTEDSPLSLATLYPLPDNVKRGEVIYANGKAIPTMSEDEWDWYVKHWGTKWDVQDCRVANNDDIVTYYFDSAWSPPVEWLEHVVMNNPDLMDGLMFSLAYAEAGMGYVGIAMGDSNVGIYPDDANQLEGIEFAEAAEDVGFEGYVAMYEEYGGNTIY
jgi:hypothetical protein